MESFCSLTALRRAHPALRRGAYRHLAAEGSVYAFCREGEGERLLVAVNAGTESVAALPVQMEGAGGAVLRWGRGEAVGRDGALHLSLPGRAAGVWSLL
jgi:alpha-glucosidase